MAIRLAVALTLLTTLDVAAQSRDWADLYREAVRHVEKREWKLAEDKLLAAKKAGPPSGPGVIKRMFNRDDYFPEYYLGIVYLNTGRPVEALTQFQLARAAKIDPREKEYKDLASLETRASTEAAAIPKPVVAPDPRQQFRTAMESAQRLLGEGKFDEAEKDARAARGLNVNNQLADGLIQNISRARTSARLKERLARPLSLQELRALLTEYASSGVSLDEVRKRIEAAEGEELRIGTERSAMLEFFAGRYEKSISVLAEAEKSSPLSPRALFYRACSLAAMATRGKTTNEAQLREARKVYAAAAQAPDKFSQDVRYISPRLIELLKGS